MMAMSISGRSHKFYKKYPAEYEHVARVLFGREEVAKSIRKVVDAHAKDPQLAVDAACGTGLITHELAGSAKRVLGIDPCAEGLAFARESKHPSLEFAHGDVNDLSPFADASIDVFSMCYASRFVHDREKFHQELARVLSPSGLAIITSIGAFGAIDRAKERCENAGLSVDVVQPRFQSLFNRFHKTSHLVMKRT